MCKVFHDTVFLSGASRRDIGPHFVVDSNCCACAPANIHLQYSNVRAQRPGHIHELMNAALLLQEPGQHSQQHE
jgi:hypothetical protein